MRGDMFAMREFLTGSVTSVFFELKIDGRVRYFHAYCDLGDRQSPERMRAAIITRGRFDARMNGGFRNPHYCLAPGKDEKPGVWLVGDEGVYIMSNGKLAEG